MRRGCIQRIALFMACCSLLIGCGESTIIRTKPAGASVWVADRYVGTSPAEAHFTIGEWNAALAKYNNSLPYRIALDGYLPKEGAIPIRVSVFRIWAWVSSAFIAAVIRPTLRVPRGEYEFELTPAAASQPKAEARFAPDVLQRLRELDKMLGDKVISQTEYEALRVQIIKDTLTAPPPTQTP